MVAMQKQIVRSELTEWKRIRTRGEGIETGGKRITIEIFGSSDEDYICGGDHHKKSKIL